MIDNLADTSIHLLSTKELHAIPSICRLRYFKMLSLQFAFQDQSDQICHLDKFLMSLAKHLLSFWQNIEPTMANLSYYWAKFQHCKWQKLNKLRGHLVTLSKTDMKSTKLFNAMHFRRIEILWKFLIGIGK